MLYLLSILCIKSWFAEALTPFTVEPNSTSRSAAMHSCFYHRSIISWRRWAETTRPTVDALAMAAVTHYVFVIFSSSSNFILVFIITRTQIGFIIFDDIQVTSFWILPSKYSYSVAHVKSRWFWNKRQTSFWPQLISHIYFVADVMFYYFTWK